MRAEPARRTRVPGGVQPAPRPPSFVAGQAAGQGPGKGVTEHDAGRDTHHDGPGIEHAPGAQQDFRFLDGQYIHGTEYGESGQQDQRGRNGHHQLRGAHPERHHPGQQADHDGGERR